MKLARMTALLLAFLAGCGGGGTEGTPSTYNETAYSTAPDSSLVSAPEIVAETRQRIAIGGLEHDVTVTAGHLNARSLGNGTPRASMFHVAYTLTGADSSVRPVTFVVGSAPGMSSAILHLGSFGPRRLEGGAIVANAQSLLELTDLVFVDPVATGLSQAIAPLANRDFFDVATDAEAMRDFVMTYVRVHGRQASPKVLHGEGYGALRAAIAANRLETATVRLRGIVLQSPLLDLAETCDPGHFVCAAHIPTYAATASHFDRIGFDYGTPAWSSFLAELRQFVQQDYRLAVGRYITQAVPPPAGHIDRVALATGMPRTAWEADPNLNPGAFRVSFIPGSILGRVDSRVVAPGPVGTQLAPLPDPALATLLPAYETAIRRYLVDTLRYGSATPYALRSSAGQHWSHAYRQWQLAEGMTDLATALSQNGALRVLAVSGAYDLAAPFHAAARDVALGAPNARVRVLEGGHMLYLDPAARAQMRAEIAAIYQDTPF